MALTDKYGPLINLAKELGADNLTIQDNGASLSIDGTVGSEADKQKLWDEYNRIDPDMRSGDLVMNVSVGGGAAGAAGGGTEYEVQAGDTLSKIAHHHGGGITWKDIYEANRDQINDPDLIHPGQKLKIPGGNA